ncbi:MAG: Asp-tRNA(Asn)/Glu-tRNA(Gln) amidotransferase subunit GatC [Victivallaceae bacterium]|nr:Asp-tRNA(Asn)/Glu-tRNA(Gln) amidotransferase subunit GatC [Victivallaceae bacterium]
MADSAIDIEYVAGLARLEIAPDEKERLQRDLDHIVDYIAELGEVDVTGVEPTAHAAALSNVWREDEIVETPSQMREVMLKNAPALMDGDLVKMPRILPGEGEH